MEIWEKISKFKIFNGIDIGNIKALNFCLKSQLKTIEKNEIIINSGDKSEVCILVVSGELRNVNYDFKMGSETLIKTYTKGELYGVEEAYLHLDEYPNTLIANKKSEILLFNKYRFLKQCENNCKRHNLLINNITNILAEMNMELMNKINILSKRTIREKVLEYLNQMSKKLNSKYFDIPYNRIELANFLSVDRSALSLELSKMKKDNIIDYNKNHFQLKK